MRRILPEVRAAGAELYVVGNGRPEYARDFLQATGLEATVFCDKSQESYRLAGMNHGKLRTVNPVAAFNALRTLVRGYMPAGVKGDPDQQGGVVVVTPAKEVVYQHAARIAGEPLPLEAMLAAVRAAAARGGRGDDRRAGHDDEDHLHPEREELGEAGLPGAEERLGAARRPRAG
ncbi:MAG TPA: peroxiredoxin-like family protein, partial [Planctomycetota bacterium]|nr:peroxiredoxin-like family protein [Planctomycetota bacterium]